MQRALVIAGLLAGVIAGGALAQTEQADLVTAFQEEAAAHRAYLEGLYSTTLKAVSVGIVVIGGLLAFLGWRTMADVKAAAERTYANRIEELLDAHGKRLDATFEAARGEIEGRLAELRKDISSQQGAVEGLIAARGGANRRPGSGGEVAAQPNKRILWVDDQPEIDAALLELFTDLGADVDVALTTGEAMERLPGDYDLVVSDMGRPEGENAGLKLLRAMNDHAIRVPYIVYDSREAVARTSWEAAALGAVDTLSSSTDLVSRVKTSLFPDKS